MEPLDSSLLLVVQPISQPISQPIAPFETWAQWAPVAATGTPVIGQYFDQDLVGSTGKMLNHFYESGQIWALLIGVVIGYGFKSFSSYG